MTDQDLRRVTSNIMRESRAEIALAVADVRRREQYRESIDTRINRLWKPREGA